MPSLAKSRSRPAAPIDNAIRVVAARIHNLQNVSVDIPRDRLVVITGVSGSGKSSLAHDTLFAEGQRRYLESISTGARSFIEQLERPDVDQVDGLPPTLRVSQRTGTAGPRSLLATTTEIFDFLRLIYARAGVAHSPVTGGRVERQSVDQIADTVLKMGDRTKLMVLAPVIRGRRGEHRAVFEKIAKDGFVRARVDGNIVDTAEPPSLAKSRSHTIDAVIDRLVVKDGLGPRLRESIELALKLGDGLCTISRAEGDNWIDSTFSEQFVCAETGESFPPLEPRSFSFNSPYGACPTCGGLGVAGIQEDGRQQAEDRKTAGRKAGVSGKVSDTNVCPECQGERLNPFIRLVTLAGLSLPALLALPVSDALAWFTRFYEQIERDDPTLDVSKDGRLAAAKAAPDIISRLQSLDRLGLGYLTLGRPTNTLSGGEYQRAQLSRCLGSGLIGVCYILDEPTIGLHPRDIDTLIDTLRELRDAGNSVLVVEHDLAVIRAADHLIDLGPGAGVHGGRVVVQGTPADVAAVSDSPTGPYLRDTHNRRGHDAAAARPRVVNADTPRLRLSDVNRHNIRGLSVEIPLGRFVAVTGVSGSGKSTLVDDVLAAAVKAALANAAGQPPEFSITGVENVRRLVLVDQTPLGRTSRSMPATYSGIWDEIRKLFARTKSARIRGFTASRFSTTSPAGRCAECRGQGTTRLAMSFLPDEHVICPVCRGRRFNRQTLAIRFQGKSVADVLAMSVDEAADFFGGLSKIHDRLELFRNVGLGYLELGRSALELSGGEAQRVRLATELSLPGRIATEPTLFLLDEPTTGLHPRDIERLIDLLQRLVDDGHSVLVIEHEPDLIAATDWVIDLGPEGGTAGGRVVASCPPAELAQHPSSHTGRALAGIVREATLSSRQSRE